MSAETLRKAAEILRERAVAVDDRDDWREYYEGPLVPHPAEGRADADWVALMSPSVGLALADWLDISAATIESAFNPELLVDTRTELQQALTVAHLIHGGAS